MGDLFDDLSNPSELDKLALEGLRPVGKEFDKSVGLFSTPEQYEYVLVSDNGVRILPVSQVLKDYKIPGRASRRDIIYLSLSNSGHVATILTGDGNMHYNIDYPNGRWRTRQDEITRRLKIKELDEKRKNREAWYWAMDGFIRNY